MKKFLAIFAAAALVGTAGFAIVKNQKSADEAQSETTSAYSETYAADEDSYYGYDAGETTVSAADVTSASQQQEQPTQAAVSTQKSFKAQIDAVSGETLIVVPDKDSQVFKSSDRISFGTSGIAVVDSNGKTVKEDDIKNFSQVQVFYSGDIMETYPAQVKAEKIVLSSREYCNVYFSVNGEIIRTLRVKTGESIESSDMPNAGAYCQDGTHFECWLDGSRSVSYLTDINDSVTLTAKISKD